MSDKAIKIACAIVVSTLNASMGIAQSNTDLEAVKAANQAFYTALSARDVGALQHVWLSDDRDIQSVGPTSKAPTIGWDGIKQTYAMTFDALPEISINMLEPTIRLHGQAAEVVGIERSILKRRDDVRMTPVTLGSNVFEKQQDGRWLLVSRHSSIVR
jgi:ketosteroid isomerase-like protein